MEKTTKLQKISFLVSFAVFMFFTLTLWFHYSFAMALHIMLLVWSLYILCAPANHGKILLAIPFKIFTGKTLVYPQIFMWSSAILLNVFTYLIHPTIYFSTILTHLLLRIISTPWPYWIIMLVCSLGTFYKLFIGQQNFKIKKFKHYTAKIILVCLGFFSFLYFSYKELVILLNIRV